jgi:hypothetical protein
MNRRIPDPAGLIAGIAFTGIGLVFLVGEVELADRARWVWPIVLFSLGAGMLAVVLRRPTEQVGGADTAVWPHAEVRPAPEEPAEAGAAVWPYAEPQPGSEAETAVEERPGAVPESVADEEPGVAEEPAPASGSAADEEPGVAEEPAPASGSAADEDAEEGRRRQAGGPPA